MPQPTFELRPCDPEHDGAFVRNLTKANFFEEMSGTVGWDEARHLQQPSSPQSYQMVYREGQRVGFFAVRAEDDALYLKTIQLTQESRGSGLGTAVMKHVESIAVNEGHDLVRLRVFKSNPATRLYESLGYVVSASDEFSCLMEKSLPSSEGPAA